MSEEKNIENKPEIKQDEPSNFNKKNRKKLISNLIFLGLAVILLIILVCSIGEINKIFATIGKIGEKDNWVYFIVALVLLAAYFLLWPLSLCEYQRCHAPESNFKDSYLIGCSEHFYNGVTPFSAGGQPFQIYSYAKRGVKASKATAIVLASFITFMIATNLIALVSLFFWPQFEKGLEIVGQAHKIDLTWFKVLTIIGFVVNFLVLVFLIALGSSRKLRNGIVWLAKLFSKIKFLKKPLSKAIPSFEEYCDSTQAGFKHIIKDIPCFIRAFLLKIATMICYYAIPYFLLFSVGLRFTTFYEFILVFFGTSFAITAVVFMPTPGGTLGIEFAFSIVICCLTPSALGSADGVTLLWRLLTYFGLMLISFICSFIFERRFNKKLKLEQQANSSEVNKVD